MTDHRSVINSKYLFPDSYPAWTLETAGAKCVLSPMEESRELSFHRYVRAMSSWGSDSLGNKFFKLSILFLPQRQQISRNKGKPGYVLPIKEHRHKWKPKFRETGLSHFQSPGATFIFDKNNTVPTP